MTSITSRNTRLCIVAFLLVAGLATAVLTVSDGTSRAATETPSASQTGAIHLAALTAAPSARTVPLLEQDFLVANGYDVAAARVLATDPAGSHVIAIPRRDQGPQSSSDQLCVIATDASAPTAGGGGCGPVTDFNRAGIFVTLSRGPAETNETVGVVPDGISSVSVHAQDGQTRSLDVAGSVVRFQTGDARSVTLIGSGRSIDRPIARGLDE